MKSDAFWQWFEDIAPKLDVIPGMARSPTFRQMFQHLDSITRRSVHIVETGCMEEPDNFAGNGCSTILFDKYVETHPGATASSIEIDADKVERAQQHCPHVTFYRGDSVKVLAAMVNLVAQPVDLLYLDASHHDWFNEAPTQAHHLNELIAIGPCLHEASLVAIDDSIAVYDDYPSCRISGKGGLVADYAMGVCAEMKFCGYQVGFTKITGHAPIAEIPQIEQVIARARLLVEAGQTMAADRLYHQVLALTPPPLSGPGRIARGEACSNFARHAHKLRRWALAVEWFTKALEADPLCSDYRCEKAICLVSLSALEKAKREAQIACEIEPDYLRNWQTLGGIAYDMRDASETMRAYDKQVEVAEAAHPADPVALSHAYQNRAVLAVDIEDYDLASSLAHKVIALQACEGDGWHILAMVNTRFARHETAIAHYDNALATGVRNQPLVHWNKALSLEAIGKLKESGVEKAWNEHIHTIQVISMPQHRFSKPKWKGQGPITDGRKTIIHVHFEGGAGDNIAMLRFFPQLLARGYEVHYECDPETLVSLVKRCFPEVMVSSRCKDYPGAVGIKAFDYHLPAGDLPHAMGTDIDTIPWQGPYLKADETLSAAAAHLIKTNVKKLKGRKIGLVWSAGIRTNISIWTSLYGEKKSMHLKDASGILNNEDTFFSLQVGDGRADLKGGDRRIHDLLSANPSWDETAALIDNLDLVITVDTGVAHLAGAMGKPTWVMMRRDGTSWHFMCYRDGASWNESSPWYPSIRLFRQHEFNTSGFWRDVVKDVNAAL